MIQGPVNRPRKSPPAQTAGPGNAADDDCGPKPQSLDWNALRWMTRFWWPYRWRYVLGIGLGMAMIVLEMQSPRYIGAIINWCTGFLQGALNPMPSEPAAFRWIAILVGAWAATMGAALVFQRLSILVMAAAGDRVQFDLRRTLFNHLQKLSMSFYDKTQLGWILSRCTGDVTTLRDINVWGVDTVVKNVLTIAMAGGMLLATEPRLFLSVAWLGPVLFAWSYFYRRRASEAYNAVRENYTRLATNLAENITGVRVVTAFNRQAHNLDAFNRLQNENVASGVAAARISGVYQPLLQLMGFTGRVIILTFGAYLVATGGIPREKGIGLVVAAFFYWEWFMGPIINFGSFYSQLMAALAGARRLAGLLETRPEIEDVPDARSLPPIVGRVEFEHVTFGYDPTRPVLHDVCFEAHPGQMVALVGATGSGKTTIISLLARFYQPQGGRVLVDGHDIRYVTDESLHRQMGLVLQTNYLFNGTVLDNIRYARPEATQEEVVAAAKAIGSYDIIMDLGDGLRTEVGERGANMSVGQRQLICFTRAFLADSRILMLDEATSAVDAATEMILQRSLERLLEGRTTFMVAHRLSTVVRADCILVIDDGRVIERGTHTELLAAGGKYAHLYERFVRHGS